MPSNLRTAAGLRETPREHLEHYLETLGVVAWEGDGLTAAFTYVSPRAEALLGYSPAAWLRPGFWADHIHPDDRDEAVRFCATEVRGCRDHDFQYRMIHADGSIRWIRDVVTIVPTDDPEARPLRGVLIDVTDRAEAERRTVESEARYRLLAENTQDMISRHDLAARYTYASPASARLIGRTPSELVGRSAYDFIHPDDRDRLRQHHAGVLDAIDQTVVFRLIRADGEPVWVESSARIVGDDATGAPVEIICVTRDVSARRRAEEALRRNTRDLQTIIDSVPAMIAHVGREGRFRYCNRRTCEVLGLQRPAIVGTPPHELLSGEAAARVERGVADALAGREAEQELIMEAGPGQRARVVQWTFMPERSQKRREVQGCFVMGHDVTEHRLAERRLRESLAAHEQLLQELNHRVKNSLSGLLTLIDLCEDRAGDVHAFADSVRRRVRAMSSVHAALTAERYESVGLGELLRLMRPPETLGGAMFSGPPVRIPPRQATAFGTVLHELMCNSMRHGALGRPDGRLRVEWTTRPDDRGAGEIVEIIWSEPGTPTDPDAVTPRTGTSLIEGFLSHELRGSIEFGYGPDGVRHVLTARIDPLDAGAWPPR